MTGYLLQRRALLRHPTEAIDRAVNKLDSLRDRQPPRILTANGYPTHEEIRAHAHRHWGYTTAEDWQPALARLLDVPELPDGFDQVWSRLGDELAAHGNLGSGLDADARLARAVWSVVRARRPHVMVETGVSRGILTRIALEAMRANGHGRLWSIDLPPLQERWQAQSCIAVRAGSWPNWTYLRGSSRWHLRRLLLRGIGLIDVFLHDSQHTERNMTFELQTARPHIRPDGVIMCDDVHENGAWRALGLDGVLAQEQVKGGIFAVART